MRLRAAGDPAGNVRFLFRVVICRSALFSVLPPPFPKPKPLLRFEEEEQSNASKHSRPLSETADAQPVRFATTTPPAARFLFVRQKETWERKSARGTFRMVPRGPSSRPREKPRGGFPHWILLPENGKCGTGDERSVAKRTDAGATAAPAFSEGRSPLRCIKGHPEKQTTIAKQIQSRQADIQHPLVQRPLVYRRTFAPFASAPWAPGCRGSPLPRSFPGFSRARETGPPEASSSQISRAAHPRLP